jgi:predicted ester cyclase
VVNLCRPVGSIAIQEMNAPDISSSQKRSFLTAWEVLSAAPKAAWLTQLEALYRLDVAWHGPHPINSIHGVDALIAQFWTPFLHAFPDVERRDDIVIAGHFKQGDWIGATGYFTATFANDWLGIAATGGVVNVRYGEFSRVVDGRVAEVYTILDILDLLRQINRYPKQLSTPLGVLDRAPAPATRDGVARLPAASEDSAKSLSLVEEMIAGLMQYDRVSLESMGMERFWHPDMMWYGPAGIGMSRRLKGFQDVHQRAFLHAFPDRVGGDHKARIAEGPYVGSTGWPSIRATHAGSWMGTPATNRRITMRVMDFWRREGNLLRENWVFIDQVDLLLQMDVDVMASIV